MDSPDYSIAESVSFPKNFPFKTTKKLFFFNEKSFTCNDFYRKEFNDNDFVNNFFIEKLIKSALENLENELKNNLNEKKNEEFKTYLKENIGDFYDNQILPNVYFILTLIISSIESGDEIKFNHRLDFKKFYHYYYMIPIVWFWSYGKKRAKYEKDFVKSYLSKEIEELNMINLINKIKTKDIIKSNISSNILNNLDSNKIFDFSEYSLKKLGKQYYVLFLQLLNNYSNEFMEDIEISIYNNLKEGNLSSEKNYSNIKELMDNLINDEESKKGFLVLVRQSYLLGKLRSHVVSLFIFNYYI